MPEFIRSTTVTGKKYDVFKTIKIVNPAQAAFYVANGVELRDMKISKDRKSDKDIFVFYFYKEETKEVYDKWCSQKGQE